MRNIIFYNALFIFFSSCTNNLDEKEKIEIWSKIKGGDVDRIIEATLEIQKSNDTSMLDALLYGADDPRITHKAFLKGMSIYQIKMSALKQITKIEPPVPITYKVDSTIINFFIQEIREYKTSKGN